jgi:hypothetical protein
MYERQVTDGTRCTDARRWEHEDFENASFIDDLYPVGPDDHDGWGPVRRRQLSGDRRIGAGASGTG